MEYDEIIGVIQQAAGGISRVTAERSAQATLQTLAERLPRGEAMHILRELPAEIKPWIYTETDAEALDIDEFLDRVAKREGSDLEAALPYACAVFFALGRALSREAVAHLAASLPQTFAPLLAEAQNRYLELMPAAVFWSRVGQRLGIDDAAARQVTDAVLETLAERIAAGQVEDLIAELDPLLHPPLERGAASAGPAARRMPVDEFLRRVAIREGAPVDEARLFEDDFEQVRAVFETLAEAVSTEEWFDVTVELSADYRGLIPAHSG